MKLFCYEGRFGSNCSKVTKSPVSVVIYFVNLNFLWKTTFYSEIILLAFCTVSFYNMKVTVDVRFACFVHKSYLTKSQKIFECILLVSEIRKAGIYLLPYNSWYMGNIFPIYMINTFELRPVLFFLKNKNHIQQNKTNLSQKPISHGISCWLNEKWPFCVTSIH